MTTFIIKESSPRLPAPSNYAQYLERVAAEHSAFVRNRRKERIVRRLTWACWVSVGVLIAVVAWRGLA